MQPYSLCQIGKNHNNARSRLTVYDYTLARIPFTKIDFNPASDNDCAHYEMYDEITYRFPNFNGVAAEVFEWMSNHIPHVAWRMIT